MNLKNTIAQLIVTTNQKKAEEYIDGFCRENHIPPYAILRIRKEKAHLGIDEIRDIGKIIPRATNSTAAIVVYDFGSARPEAQNAFLKTLEERTLSVQFFVLVSEQSSVLPTILSRCKLVRLTATEKVAKPTLDGQRSLGKLLSRYSNIQKDRKKGLAFCRMLLDFSQEKIYNCSNNQTLKELARFTREIIQTTRFIERNNVNPQVAIDQLLIHLAKIKNLS